MDFKKRFDYEDINNFLPDNQTIAKTEYFNKKFKGKMPDYICDILEIKSRVEFKEEEENKFIDMIKESVKNTNQKLMEEFEERSKQTEDIEENLSTLSLEDMTYLDDAK
jgi:hypothetical protein